MEKPIMVAMIICDQIITEEGSHKKSLIGCFNNISSANYPFSIANFFVFVALTNGMGSFTAKLKCVNEEDSSIIFEVGGPIIFSNPMQTIEMGFRLVNLVFPKPGIHAIQFWCDDELLMPKRFTVHQIQPNKPL